MSLVGRYKIDNTTSTVDVRKNEDGVTYDYRWSFWKNWQLCRAEKEIRDYIKREGWIKQSQLPDKSDIED